MSGHHSKLVPGVRSDKGRIIDLMDRDLADEFKADWLRLSAPGGPLLTRGSDLRPVWDTTQTYGFVCLVQN